MARHTPFSLSISHPHPRRSAKIYSQNKAKTTEESPPPSPKLSNRAKAKPRALHQAFGYAKENLKTSSSVQFAYTTLIRQGCAEKQLGRPPIGSCGERALGGVLYRRRQTINSHKKEKKAFQSYLTVSSLSARISRRGLDWDSEGLSDHIRYLHIFSISGSCCQTEECEI